MYIYFLNAMQDLFNLLILIAVIHAYVFTWLLLYRPSKSSRILGIYMLFVFIEYLLNANMYLWNNSILYACFFFINTLVMLSQPPLIFLYVKHLTTENFKFRFIHIFHFLPAFLLTSIMFVQFLTIPSDVIHQILFQFSKTEPYYSNLKNWINIGDLVFFLQVFSYYPIILWQLAKHDKQIAYVFSYRQNITLQWMWVFIGFVLAYNFYQFFVYIFNKPILGFAFYLIAINFHVFFVGIMGLKQKEIYPVLQDAEKNTHEESTVINSETTEAKLHITPEQQQIIAEKLIQLMEEKKLFLNPDLSLYDLSKQLNLPRTHVSFVINTVFQKNFYHFVNHYRVEEAKKILIDPAFNHYSIEGVATTVGFKARNVFYMAFKKEVGMTPGEYRSRFGKKS
ncbi:MAG: AraC family transcriptional regulator [Bacteroidales bacterium]|nr:AraC family transcriptional regulator [Bacteroidales bacterium]